MTHIDPAGIAVVMTEFGEYVPTAFELETFQACYGHEPPRMSYYDGLFFSGFMPSPTPRWQEELCDYASAQMRQQWGKQ